MVRLNRVKACDRCNQTDPVLYRVQVHASEPWIFVCAACFPAMRQTYPDYTYGGTWKAKKRS